MKSKFLSKLVTEELLGSKYARLSQSFVYRSMYLNQSLIIHEGFVFDYESVPLLKATSKRGGLIHDYLCRTDSTPVVTKQEAATVYLEAQECRDQMLESNIFSKLGRFLRRHTKTLVVRAAPGYFHKFSISATLEDLTG